MTRLKRTAEVLASSGAILAKRCSPITGECHTPRFRAVQHWTTQPWQALNGFKQF